MKKGFSICLNWFWASAMGALFLVLASSCTFAGVDSFVFQQMNEAYSGKACNSYEPRNEVHRGVNKAGLFEDTQIFYGWAGLDSDSGLGSGAGSADLPVDVAGEISRGYAKDKEEAALRRVPGVYPNSFLDVYYCGETPELSRHAPTLLFLHGGCFWWGTTTSGNPIKGDNLYDYVLEWCKNGFNVVQMDYALAPDYLFPVPLEQVDFVVKFLKTHADELCLSLDRLVLGGNSAGSVICTQYVTAVSNEKYRKKIGLGELQLSPGDIKSVIVDDGFFDWEHMNSPVKVVAGNYMARTIYLGSKAVDSYDAVRYISSDFPPAVFVAGIFDHDGKRFVRMLRERGKDALLICPRMDRHEKVVHCYLMPGMMVRDPKCVKDFEKMAKFVKDRI